MRFLVDNQLPPALARFMAGRGVDCRHVLDVGLAQSCDSEVWKFAAERRLVLMSKDEDFFHLAGRPGAAVQVVWVRIGNCRTSALLNAVEDAWSRIRACLEAGERIVELR